MRRLFGSGLPWMGLFVVLATVALWPGLRGGFLFDDYPNLESLGAYGAVDSLPALARFLTSGIADPTGRPLSMLSFLVDARNWPTDPYPFKRTNLILHLINGLLLFAALRELGRAYALDFARTGKTAALAAGIWMLHPLFVSTTMYIVQREAMLPATFGFATLWIWLLLRRRLLDGAPRAAWSMAAVVVCGTALSTLCKSNGVLLPALLLVVEGCLPRIAIGSPQAQPESASVESTQGRAAASLRNVKRWLLWLPTLGLSLAVFAALPGSIASAAANRPWTLRERLLTEPRVIFDYLGQLLLPRPFSRGLFNDDFIASHSLLYPWTTLPALAGLILLACIAWGLRSRAPSIALALGFYLVGQSIESGPFPLELYFEHRNYLPAALAFWPLALWLTGDGGLPRVRQAIALALPFVLALLTWINASMWGDSSEQAIVWGSRNPDSPRAQAYAAQFELGLGHPDLAEHRLRNALRTRPMEVQLLVNLVGTRCVLGSLSQSDLDATAKAFRTAPDPTRLAFKWLRNALPTAQSGSCSGFGMAQAGLLARSFAENPRTALLPGRTSDAENLLGLVALSEGRFADARAAFDAAFNAEHSVDVALTQAAMLASANQPELALGHLALGSAKSAKAWYRWRSMTDVNDWVMYRQGFWQQQIDELRGKIVADIKAKH